MLNTEKCQYFLEDPSPLYEKYMKNTRLMHKVAHSIMDYLLDEDIIREFNEDNDSNLCFSDEDDLGDDSDDGDETYGENAFNDMVSTLKRKTSIKWGGHSPLEFLYKYFMQLLDLRKYSSF